MKPVRADIRTWARRVAFRAVALIMGIAMVVTVGASPASAVEQIQGSGSSWAYNAISVWISDTTAQGLQVVFTPSGSAQGRQDYSNGVTDFAVSDIGYQGQNPVTGVNDSSLRKYAYLPIVGGATTFPYNLTVAGQQVQNLRLSGLTLAKIFTDQITNWDDPEITADNNGHALPSIPIIPVVHSEGAGSTFQFTDWLDTEYPNLWQSFSGYNFPVEFWPTGKGSQVAENGSDGVMNFVASGAGAGSIAFDEYSYALGANYPVAAIENKAGWFTMPDAYDAAVALTQAQINYTPGPDYLLETLNNVYSYNDPRTYPLSSYSYEILPTASCHGAAPNCDPSMDTGKRQALANFDSYSLCQGQSQMAAIGYSPLPINLVEASFKQVDLLNAADPNVNVANVNVASCNNPTFVAGQPDENLLAKIAPFPPACAQAGAGPCAGQYAHNGNPVNGVAVSVTPLGSPGHSTASSPTSTKGAGSSGAASTSASGGGGVSSSAAAATGGGGTSAEAAGGTPAAASGGSVSAADGGAAGGSSGASGPTSTSQVVAQGVPTVLAASRPEAGGTILLELLAAALVLGALAGPAVVRRSRWRKAGR